MARGFGSTLGTGSTDRITTGYSSALSTTHTVSAWIFENGAGGASKGRIFDASNNSNGPIFGENSANVASTMLVGENFSSSQGTWYFTRPSLNAWHHVCFTYNGSSTSNAPTVYVDGSPVSTTVQNTPVGTYTGTSNALYLGNRADNARNWDGSIAECVLWNGSILTASEVAALAKGLPPLFVRPASLTLYLPLFGTQTNDVEWGPSHLSPGVTGAKYQNHAPVNLWMPGATVMPVYPFSGSLTPTQAACAAAITAREKFTAGVPLTAFANTAAINLHQTVNMHPGRASVFDAAQGGLLNLADRALYDVQITESI